MTFEEENALALKLGIVIETEEEYDDNNYFDADYITEILGIRLKWSSYQVELFGEAVEAIKALEPSVSFHYVTEIEKPTIEEIENLKNKDEFSHNESIIDVCLECLRLNLDLDKCLSVISKSNIY